MTIVVVVKNTEKLGGRNVEARKEHHSGKTDYRNESVTIGPQEQREFTLWGPWTVTLRENEP